MKKETYTREDIKSALIKKLISIMPKENILEDFKGKDVYDAIQWGMKKQENMERAIYQRAIDEMDLWIEKNV